MRTLYLFTLALLATVASADNVSNITVSAFVSEDPINPAGPRVPGCGGDAQGAYIASITFECESNNEIFRGSAFAETGVGPYGTGVDVNLYSEPGGRSRAAISSASFSWSQDVVVLGAQGSGTAEVTLDGNTDIVFLQADFELFNEFVPGLTGDTFIIPITFGASYTNTMSGTAGPCFGIFGEDCFDGQIFVSSLSFFDAEGNPLPDAHLVNVPELSGWLLLATCGVALCFGHRLSVYLNPVPGKGQGRYV